MSDAQALGVFVFLCACVCSFVRVSLLCELVRWTNGLGVASAPESRLSLSMCEYNKDDESSMVPGY